MITAGTLQVTNSDVNLAGVGNAIDTLGPISSFDSFIHLIDGSALTVSGLINLPSPSSFGVFLQSAKDVTINTPIALSAPAPVTIQAGGKSVCGGGCTDQRHRQSL